MNNRCMLNGYLRRSLGLGLAGGAALKMATRPPITVIEGRLPLRLLYNSLSSFFPSFRDDSPPHMSSTTSAVSSATSTAASASTSTSSNLKVGRLSLPFLAAADPRTCCYHTGCRDHPRHNEWPAHRIQFCIQEERTITLAGGRARRGRGISEISESCEWFIPAMC